jgi:deoxyribonuclease V
LPIRLIAGADCCYARIGRVCAAAVVVWDVEAQEVVQTATALSEARFPYVPGLLALREAPGIVGALAHLRAEPQVLICDGHGVAHPRRFGLACHVGVLSGLPTIGCAKRRLCGTFREPGNARGSRSPLTDGGEIIGTVLRTQTGVRPLFVSVGHLIELSEAEQVILACTVRFRLPEPLRLAHRQAAECLPP